MTNGLSPKAVLAFFFPFITTIVGVATTWVIEGTFDETAIRVAVAGLLASGLALLGAYVGKPGDVTEATGPASDSVLSAEAHAALGGAPAGDPQRAGDA